jgi:thiamine transport system substrate-binding protein
MKKQLLTLLTLLALVATACAQAQQTAAPTATEMVGETPPATQPAQASTERQTLKVMTHDSFAVSEPVVTQFEQENNVTVQFVEAGDTGTALNKAILSKDNPLADVFYGVDNTFLSRALEEGIFEPYDSPLLSEIPDRFKLDPQNRALPVDYGDVCLNYDKAYFKDQGIDAPQNLEDLSKPEYNSLLVVENPATSSPGLAFLLATIGHFGQDNYLNYWEGLVKNDVLVVNDWNAAYYTEFSVHGGQRPIVVSYNSSPPAEVIFAEQPLEEPPTGVVLKDESCFRQIEFVGILAGTQKRNLAEKWIDYMLSVPFQEDMPLQMFVFPVNPNAKLPEEFTKFITIPDKTAQVSPQVIRENRETWIQAWTETVLR